MRLKKMKRNKNGYRVLEVLLSSSDGICYICNKQLEDFQKLVEWVNLRKQNQKTTIRRKRININIDHVIPLSKGGTDCLENTKLVHFQCNEKKSNKTL